MNSRTFLLSPWLFSPGLYLIHGLSNSGKTFLALGVACAVASGSKFLEWSASKPAKVLFVNGELRGYDLQAQLKAILADMNMNIEGKSLPLWFVGSDLPYEPYEIDLSTRPWLEMLEEAVISDGIQLIVLNNVGTLCHSKQGKLKAWCLKMRDQGKAILVIRTDYRGKKGTKTFRPDNEDLFDVIIRLTRPEGCHSSIGHFRKARDLRGAAMKNFIISLRARERDIKKAKFF